MYRDHALDIIRGICAIGVIMIHTTFWSGGSYVPQIIQSLSLLIDVPAFFFIGGASLALSTSINPLGILWKMMLYFGVVMLIYDIFASLHALHFSLSNTLGALTLSGLHTPLVPVLAGSYWFVPVFCVASIAGALLLKYVRLHCGIILLTMLLIYVLHFCGAITLSGSFLGVSLNYLVFYTALFILGYICMRDDCFYLFARYFITIGALGFLALYLLTLLGFFTHKASLFNLQAHKFPVALPYVCASLCSIGVLLLFYSYLKRVLRQGGGGNLIRA